MLASRREIDPRVDLPLVDWSELSVSGLLPTGTVTLLLAEVGGSTQLWETQPAEMTAAIARFNQVDNYLRGIDARGGAPTERRLDDTDLPARERLLAIFDLHRSEVVRGCAFHNAAVESAGPLASTDEIVRTRKQEFTRRLVAVAREAGATDPELLGQQLAVLFEGATAMATSLSDTAPVVHARAAAATPIDAALAVSDPEDSSG
jgi:hypothetical protein